MPFRNADRHLSGLLESLAAQAAVPDSWEIVLVDNRSTDRSRRIAEQFAERLSSRIVDAPARANPAYARNVGVRSSAGHKLMFADADDELEPGYVAAMAEALEDHGLVTSRVDSTTLNPVWVRDAQGPPWQADGIGAFHDFLPAAGINIGIHRDLYDRLGGFPEDFAASEDIALSWTASITERVQLHFVRSAVYRYRYRDSLRELFFQSLRGGSSSALLYRRFRDLGMPARSLKAALREWQSVLAGLRHAYGRAALAPLVVRLGYCVGRLQGSARHRVMFL